MINVAMGVEDIFYLKIIFCNKRGELVLFFACVAARVNDYRLVGFIKHHIRVFSKRIEGKRLNGEHSAKVRGLRPLPKF